MLETNPGPLKASPQDTQLSAQTQEKFGNRPMGGEPLRTAVAPEVIAREPNRADTIEPALQKVDPNYSILINYSHSTDLLQKLGIIDMDQDFAKVLDPAVMAKVKEKGLTVVFRENDPEHPTTQQTPESIRITGKDINELFEPSLKTKVREIFMFTGAKNAAKEKRAQRREIDAPIILSSVILQARQVADLTMTLHYFEMIDKKQANEERYVELIDKSVANFQKSYDSLVNQIDFMKSLIATMKYEGIAQDDVDLTGSGLEFFEKKLATAKGFLKSDKADKVLARTTIANATFPKV